MKVATQPLARFGVVATAVFALFIFVAQLFAAPASLEWYSFPDDPGDVLNYGVYDQTNTAVLAQGDLVQLIWTGPNGQIDPPNYDGTPSGDDVLLDINTIENSLPGPYANRGLITIINYAYETTDPQALGIVYMRAWDHPTAGGFNGATYYGESGTLTLDNTNQQPFNALRWHTNKSATLPEIAVAQGATPLTSGQSVVAYGTTLQNNPITYTYTITNIGVDPLILTPTISVPAGFAVAQTFGTTSVVSQTSTTFQVALTAATPGSYTGTVSFANNDTNENPFTFTVSGTVIAPEIVVSEAGSNIPNGGSVNYGTTNLPTPITKTFTISNTGTADLTLANLTVPTGFSIVSGLTSPVTPGNAIAIQVRLTGSAPGNYSGSLSFNTNDADENPYSFTVSGQVVAPEIVMNQGSNPLTSGVSTVAYGTTMGGTAVARSYTITNTGTADLLLSSLSLPTGYSATSLPATLTPGQSGLLTITLTAVNPGTFNGTVQFTTNDADENPFSFGVTGNVIDPEIVVWDGPTNIPDNSGSVNFGTVIIGNPVTKTFTISNTGTADLLLSDLAVPSGFAIITGLGSPTTVTPGNATTIMIELEAAVIGNYSGALSFTTNDRTENPFNFTISGNVTAVPEPEIEVRDGVAVLIDGSSTVNYGSTTQGTPLNKTFTVQNFGTADLTLAGLTVPSGFNIVQNFGDTTLSPTESTTFIVALTAATLGNPSGQISFTNNDGDESPFNFTVNGTVTAVPAPELTVLDGSDDIPNNGTVDYGSTTIDTPLNKMFTVRNDGTATLTLAGLAVTTGFEIVEGFGSSSLAPTEETTFTVALTATSVNSFTGTITFTNNDDGESPFTINVIGEVTAVPEPEIVVERNGVDIPDNTGALDYGSTISGTAVIRTFTVRNTGTADLTLANLSLGGSGFSIATGFGNTTVVPGSSTTFQIRLDAAVVGSFNGTITFDNNDADENPYNFAVTGSVSATPEPSLAVEQGGSSVTNGGTVSFGSTVAGSPVERLFTVRNDGTAVLTLAALTVVGDGFSISQEFASTNVGVGESTTFAIQLDADTVDSFNATVSFTSNDADQTPFSFEVTGAATAPATPEIEVRDGATNIPLDSTVDMGTTIVGTAVVKTFTIRNTGSQTLTVGTPTLPAGYTLLTTPATEVSAGGNTTFQVQLDAAAVGTFAGQVSISNNDSNENPFTFALTAVVEDGSPRIYLPFVSRN
ncbi:MAG: choice-of-anchor D domain-containing protein [Chloroflexi bacterium]|nr:choice-of-anchor D domain-containing protein [Chloroflexota bacterium]